MSSTQTKTVQLITDLEQAYFDYAVETITDRALPRVEDGLKPGQRRILYAMHTLGLHPDKPPKKSARVVGEVLGKYHPHGDSSVYGALVRMAQEFSMRHPLIEGQGNFGSIDGDAPAAMRYTEARMAAIAAAMMQDLRRNAVNWTENFDHSLTEPVILPAVFPNLLVNGGSGVAVGMATNIPPHNLGEVCDALVYVVKRWAKRDSIAIDDLLRFIPGPDFPTGGVLYRYRIESGRNGAEEQVEDTIRTAYSSGRGGLITQARLSVEATRGGKADIIVTELPYAVQKSTVLERIAKEVRDGRIAGVTDLRDESDYSGLRIVIEVSRVADPGQVLESLLTYTQLRQTFSVTHLALVEEEGEVVPRLLSLREMLTRFIEHRLTVIERRSRHELAEREARLHIIEGLLRALDVIDEVIATIKKSKSTDSAWQNLIRSFKFSNAQARAILEMQLRGLAALEREKLQAEAGELQKRIKVLRGLLASEQKRLKVVIEETMALKETFATPRRTVILDNEPDQTRGGGGTATVLEADLVRPEGPQIIALTNQGVKRCDKATYRYQARPGVSSRAVESHWLQLEAAPEEMVLFVTNRGRVWRAPVRCVPESESPAGMGLAEGEWFVTSGIVDPEQYLVLVTRTGNIKRVAVRDLRGSEGVWHPVIGLAGNNDEVLCAGVSSAESQVMLFTAKGKAIRFESGPVRTQATPGARGVKAITLRDSDSLIAGLIFDPAQISHVIILSKTGCLKRTPLNEFPLQKRGGQGVRCLAVNKQTGAVARVAAESGARFVDLITVSGRRQRLVAADIPEADRVKAGKKLMQFKGDTVSMVVPYL